jgi:ferritin-like metal-binding protein YciE
MPIVFKPRCRKLWRNFETAAETMGPGMASDKLFQLREKFDRGRIMDVRTDLIGWLHDAYAMERNLETTLKKISKSDQQPEECRAACRKHLLETEQHAHVVESLLKSLGADPLTFKTGLGLLAETMKGAGAAVPHDHVVKEIIASYTSEHFEIACYEAIVAAAMVAGLPYVAEACLQIILEEKKMAQTIDDMLPGIVRFYLGEKRLAKAA